MSWMSLARDEAVEAWLRKDAALLGNIHKKAALYNLYVCRPWRASAETLSFFGSESGRGRLDR